MRATLGWIELWLRSLLLVSLVAVVGCATGLTRAGQSVLIAADSEQRAERVYVEHVRRTEDEISTAAEQRRDPDGGRAALAKFRASHRPVQRSLEALRVALYAATEGLLLAREGTMRPVDLDALVRDVMAAAANVAAELARIGVPGLASIGGGK